MRLPPIRWGSVRRPVSLASSMLALSLASCAAPDTSDDSDLAGTTRESASARTGNGVPASATQPMLSGTAALSDTAMLQFLATVDNAEIESGTLAARKGRRSEVRAFGEAMAAAHKADMAELIQLGGMTGIVREESRDARTGREVPAGTALNEGRSMSGTDPFVLELAKMQRRATEVLGTLDDTFDREYVAAQVVAHQRVLDVLSENSGRVTTPSLREHLRITTDAVGKHLAQARVLQQRIAGAPIQ